jgi:hypothetical protein
VALYRLSIETMIGLSKTWTETRREEVKAIPQTFAILPLLEAAHKGLFLFTGRDSETPKLRSISRQQTEVDHQHDDFYRAGFHYLNGLSALYSAMGQEEDAQKILELRDVLYPDGLFGVNRSYPEEEGAAELLERRLTDSIKARLSTFLLAPGVTLLHVVVNQIARARELGRLEQEKRKVQEQEAQNPSPSLGDERRARFDWIEAVRMLERTLRLAVRHKTTTEPTINNLLADLQREEADADQKYLEEKKKEQGAVASSQG